MRGQEDLTKSFVRVPPMVSSRQAQLCQAELWNVDSCPKHTGHSRKIIVHTGTSEVREVVVTPIELQDLLQWRIHQRNQIALIS